VTLIRNSLSECPDESPRAGTADLLFISDADLRGSIRLDISAANTDLLSGEWKGATVLAGAAVEALLLWVLQDTHGKQPSLLEAGVAGAIASEALKKPPKGTLEEWDLYEYTEVATHAGFIKKDTASLVRQVRGFRNLIHPGRAQRLAQRCDRGTALAALAAVEFVVRDLTQCRHAQSRPTARED